MEILNPANLLDQLDKKVMVWLRDGRTIVGYLRSIDQFANLVIHHAIERIYIENKFGDIPRGIILIRGENVALTGELDSMKDQAAMLKEVSMSEVLQCQQKLQTAKVMKEQTLSRAFKLRGLSYNPADNSLELQW